MTLLSDLSGTLADMPPATRKRNLHRIFTRIDFGEDGEISHLSLHPWAQSAFGDLDVANYAEGGNRTHTPCGTRF